MAEREHPFPMKEPEVTVTPRPDAELKEILRADAGGFFVPLEVGAEVKWSFYDWPERQLTNVAHTRIVGEVKYRGQDCLDVIDRVIWGEGEDEWGRWLYLVSDETLGILLREMHWTAPRISEVDITPEPLRLTAGHRWQGHEIYRCGPEEEGAGEQHHGLVETAFEVVVPAGDMLCLRETRWHVDAAGVAKALAETYVAQTGRTIYFRRFNGPAYHNYEQLAGNPEREHDGVVWRLWYECLPDIALAPSGNS